GTTEDHVFKVLQLLAQQPELCSHLEMETYTWAVLPESLKSREVSEQIVAEYAWTLQQLKQRGLVPKSARATKEHLEREEPKC
ncbi:MAG TPA: hypothetical protein VNT26_06365, partial [Candidatus Sulfotelmatobacter sp.]|nr:hypothetical protein [Candidatus Sulfotelmatobacter sp.]